MLETKLAEAKSKKDTLKARAASAKTSKQIQEMLGSLNTSNAVVAFEKMEEKVSIGAHAHQPETTKLAYHPNSILRCVLLWYILVTYLINIVVLLTRFKQALIF